MCRNPLSQKWHLDSTEQSSCRLLGAVSLKGNPKPAVEPSTGVSAAHFCEYGGSVKNIYLGIAFFCSLFLTSSASTQTFEINGQSSDRPKQDQQKKGKK